MTPGLPKSATHRKARLGLFRSSGWDVIPAALLYLQFGLIVGFILIWPQLSWPARLGCGAFYALSVGWCLDTIAHNFVHNPFFASEWMNRLTGHVLTLVLASPQTGYAYTHMRHHAGSSDRIGADGRTIDPISLYQYGADGKAEPVWSYALRQYWRDEGPLRVIARIAARRPAEARAARQELMAMLAVYAGLLAVNWQAVLFLAPWFYLGQVFSSLIAYYEHFGAEPEVPLATGISTYAPLYNWVFFNNGYHNEHHARPKAHWTQMPAVRRETEPGQRAAGARTLRAAHFLGFLDRWTWRVPTARAARSPRQVRA